MYNSVLLVFIAINQLRNVCSQSAREQEYVEITSKTAAINHDKLEVRTSYDSAGEGSTHRWVSRQLPSASGQRAHPLWLNQRGLPFRDPPAPSYFISPFLRIASFFLRNRQ